MSKQSNVAWMKYIVLNKSTCNLQSLSHATQAFPCNLFPRQDICVFPSTLHNHTAFAKEKNRSSITNTDGSTDLILNPFSMSCITSLV